MVAKYYAFTRVNPRSSDYERLVQGCQDSSAYLAYRTVRDSDKTRLVGFVVFWREEDDVPNIERMFPNFNLTPIVDDHEHTRLNLDKLIALREGSFVSAWHVLFNKGGSKAEDELCNELDNLGI